MSKITLVKGEHLIDVAKETIKCILPTKNNLNINHICIVPDRFSLITEKLIFSTLKIKSTLNINVMGINKLAKLIIKESGLNCLYINDDESKMLVRRAMQKTKKDFMCFSKNITFGVAEEVQKTLSQLKSSNISVNMLRQISTDDLGLSSKLHDIILIYEEYENLLGEKMDAPQILNVFASLIEQKDLFKNTKFFFIGFDSLTIQGYEIVKRLSKKADITIGALYHFNKNNRYIYDVELVNKIKEFAKKESIPLEEIEQKQNLSAENKVLDENLFAYKEKEKYDTNNFVNIYESSDTMDEVMFVAKQISYLVKQQNYRYKDFCICADSSYYPFLRNVLKECDISYFDDQSYNLYSSLPAKFIKNLLDLKENNFNKDDIIKFLSLNFVGLDKDLVCDAINKTLGQGITGNKIDELYTIIPDGGKYIIEEVKKFKLKDTIENYATKLISILQNIDAEEKINKIIENFKEKNDIFLEKVYLQVYEKIKNILNMLIDYIGEEEISISDFSFLIESGLKTVEIRSVPMSIDCVFIGDSQESFYPKHKILFVVGANDGVLPVQNVDKGLVSDKDIENVSSFVNIEPTIRMVNKRNKFKLYDLLMLPRDKLFITYKNIDAEGKNLLVSSFVNNIYNSYNNFNKIKDYMLDVYNVCEEENIKNILFNNPNKYYANINVCSNNKQNAQIIKQSLKNQKLLENYQKNDDFLIKNPKKLFFSKNYTKISQIESYYSCPFLHFLRYGVKLKEQKNCEIKVNFIGNFLHRFGEVYIKNNKTKLGKLSTEEIDKITTEITEKLVNDEFNILNFKENIFVKDLLLKEANRFALFINLEQSASLFKPTRLEQYFGNKTNTEVKVSVNNENYDIVGVIDRIDEYDKYFRIIDYKTGSLGADAASYDSLYYGRKIQIFVYLKATQNLLNKDCFGVFYLPISNAYKNKNEDHYKMKGFFLDDENLVKSADSTISMENSKSKFFEAEISTAKTTKGFKLNGKNKKFMQKEELLAMTEYAVMLVKQAIQEILEGNITVSPFNGVCEYCDFKNLCKIELCKNRIRKKLGDKITCQTFVEVKNGNN